MNALFTILTVLIIIASIFLVIAVLLQNSKGDGMASNFIADIFKFLEIIIFFI